MPAHFAMRKACHRKVRPARTPITRGLLDSFAQELHFSLMTARLGHFNTEAFDKIGATLNVIWAALELKPQRDPSFKVVIEGCMRTMNEVAARGDRSGVWKLDILELASVSAAAQKAEQALAWFNVEDLYHSMQKLAVIRAEHRAMKAMEERKAAKFQPQKGVTI